MGPELKAQSSNLADILMTGQSSKKKRHETTVKTNNITCKKNRRNKNYENLHRIYQLPIFEWSQNNFTCLIIVIRDDWVVLITLSDKFPHDTL